jgi:hypothetical protein
MTSQSALHISRTFHLNNTYLGENATVTYSFSCDSVVGNTFGLPVNLTLFRDKQLKNLVTSVTSGHFSNINNVSPNMTWSYNPTVGLTVSGLSGAPIMFTPGNGVAIFDLTLTVEHGTNAGSIGPAFNNNTDFDITMSPNPEVAPFLTIFSEKWTCYSTPRPFGPP